jgi:predicted RNA-binding protein YlxR (DUF448 family)
VPALTRRQPQRTCVSCRETGDKRRLTRLIRSPDGRVQLDATGRLPGRGAYLCSRQSCWQRALSRGDVLARALRTTVSAEDREALLAQAPQDEANAARNAIGEVAETGSSTQ